MYDNLSGSTSFVPRKCKPFINGLSHVLYRKVTALKQRIILQAPSINFRFK